MAPIILWQKFCNTVVALPCGQTSLFFNGKQKISLNIDCWKVRDSCPQKNSLGLNASPCPKAIKVNPSKVKALLHIMLKYIIQAT